LKKVALEKSGTAILVGGIIFCFGFHRKPIVAMDASRQSSPDERLFAGQVELVHGNEACAPIGLLQIERWRAAGRCAPVAH
jgi:hypothetical protein